MKTSAELQAQSVRRKLIYFGLIVVLFSLVTFSGSLARTLTGKTQEWTLAMQAERLQLTETSQGQADVAGSTVRLSLTGARGFVVCYLWISAIETQKRHEWNKLEVLVQSITKLQPHFLTPWLFQSWNLSYNVSVESDRVRDKYFYIAKGIQLLAEGERINRGHGHDEDGEYVTGNPDMRYWIGFYYQNKLGAADEANTLRSLMQMSCIKPSDRTGLRTAAGVVDSQRFQEFVKKHPMLVRRLRDRLGCKSPDLVVDFLTENSKIPSRYEEVESGWELKRNLLDQFPVAPEKTWDPRQSGVTIDEGTLRGDYTNEFDNYHAALWWMCFAQDPLPPYEVGKPARAMPPEKPLRHRVPRSPMLILFRQAPSRSMTYVSEALQKEGWFDESGWDVDQDQASAAWFPGLSPRERVVGADPRFSARHAWNRAYNHWDRHGEEHGLKMDQARKDLLNDRARRYRDAYQVQMEAVPEPGKELVRGQVDDDMWASYDAHLQLLYLGQNLTVTNYRHFLYRSQAEQDPRVVEVRRLFYDANRHRRSGDSELAIRSYRAAFDRLCGNIAEGRRGLLEEFTNFRADNQTQEDFIEHHYEYLRLLYEHRNAPARAGIAIGHMLAAGNTPSSPTLAFVAAGIFQFHPNPRQMPLFVGPLDGVDSAGRPWVTERNIYAVKSRLGLLQPAPQPTGDPPGGGPAP